MTFDDGSSDSGQIPPSGTVVIVHSYTDSPPFNPVVVVHGPGGNATANVSISLQ